MAGVAGTVPRLLRVPRLSEVHNGNAVAYVAHDRKIMRDKKIGQVEFLLQILEEVNHLCLYGDVECGKRLVADDQFRVDGQGARYSNPLALPAAEFVRDSG